MESIRTKIVGILSKKPLKPGELAEKLGISRQALHRHLHVLVVDKQIQKHGAGPHVTYSAATLATPDTRVRKDYLLCTERLLPSYLERFADTLQGYARVLESRTVPATAKNEFDFGFLLDTAAVYSSKIEGNTLDLNSFLNSRLSPRQHRPKEAQEIEDLVSAYMYARKSDLDERRMLDAHAILSRNFVARSRQGIYRQEPVGVFSRQGLEYMAVESSFVEQEMREVFAIVAELLHERQTHVEYFFWAAWLHVMIALIHPFSDGNGRTARLCEKWFLVAAFGEQAFAFPSEEYYWMHRSRYYAALKLGANYWETDMSRAMPFFEFLPNAIANSV